MLSDQELLRYSRQIMLPQLDAAGQMALKAACVAIVGVGGLGSPVALYLAAAGIGELRLIDDDRVEISNLQRQIAHRQSELGNFKADSAARLVQQVNEHTTTHAITERLQAETMQKFLQGVDLVVDCCDNFATRFMLNRYCFESKTPLVSGAAIRWEGQLTSFKYEEAQPCYRCLYDESAHTDQTCSSNGVIAPLVGIIGSMQAIEAIKILAGCGQPLVGELLLFDALDMSQRKLRFKQRADCPVCSSS